MTPQNGLLSQRSENEAYCLAESGRQFAVFFTGEGDRSVRLDVSSVKDEVSLCWLNIAQARWLVKRLVPPDPECLLQAPGDGHWAAVLQSGSYCE
jgi:hypothetical protein